MSLATIQIGPHLSVQGDLGDTWFEGGVQVASVAMDGKLYVGKLVEARNTAHHDDQDHDMTPLDQRGGDGV